MALNQNLKKLEEEEQARLRKEMIEARVQQDRNNMAAMYAPTMDTIRNTPEGMSLEAPAEPNVAVASVIPGTNKWDNSPNKLTNVEQGVVDFFTPSEEVVETPKSKLQADLANLNANKNVGAAPARQEAPQSITFAHPQYEVGSFNEIEQNNGFPLGYLSNTAMIESNMNPNAKNPNSTAKGLFQFIDQTASDLGLTDPFDPQQSTDAMIKLTKQNQGILRNTLGREPTGEELYIMHQQGATNGLKVLQGDPNANAVQTLGRAEVLKNGGNESMTVQDFKNLWGAKYNRISGTTRESAPAIETVFNPEAEERQLDGGVSNAMKNNIPETTAKALANRKFDENGFIEFDENSGYDFDGGFQHRNYETSDSGALWQGVLAGGVGMLVAALAGGSKEDIGASFAVGAATRFTDAMNQSHRYKNLDALKKQGYTAESIEAFNHNGDRSQLVKHKFGEWKEYPDGSGDLVRTLPNGKQQMKKGVAKYTARKDVDPVTGDEYTRYFNPVYGYQRDENNNIIRDLTGKATSTRLDTQAGATPQTYIHTNPQTGVKEEKTVFTTPNGFVSVSDRRTPVTLGADAQLKVEPKDAGARKAGQPSTDDEIEANRMRNSDVFNTLTNGIYNADGSLNTTPPEMDTYAGNAIAGGNWANAGGGRGVVPVGENWLTSGNSKGEIAMRKRVTDAKTMQAQVRNMAIQIAKDSGASGINTVAEIRLFAESFPPIDFSSYASMITSMDNLRRFQDTYSQNYRLKVQQSREVMEGKSGSSTIGNVDSQNEEQEKAAWKEMEQYYGGGQGAQYLTENTANAMKGQGSGNSGVTKSGYRFTKL